MYFISFFDIFIMNDFLFMIEIKLKIKTNIYKI